MTARRSWLLATALLILATNLFVAGIRGVLRHSTGPPVPPRSAGKLHPPSGSPRLKVSRSIPVRLRIPAIKVATSLSRLGLNADGTVQVPTDFRQPGWFRLGPTPGQLGSAVILGHVDSYRGPAVFFRLGDLRAGDRVVVTLADGAVTRFVVEAVAIYPKAQFPARRVYGSHRFSALQLVTCGGAFDHHTGHYLSNVVVYTRLAATTPASAAV